MSSKRDYYEVLGLDKKSSPDEIKKQYRKLALKFHPDRNSTSDAAEHFKEISEAYAVLSDESKRQLYDQYGHEGVDGRYSTEDIFSGAKGSFDEVFGGRGSGFESLFAQVFGGRGSSHGAGFGSQRGADRLVETTINLEDVLHGVTIDVEVTKRIACKECGGSGCRQGGRKETCEQCRGHGIVGQTQRMGFASVFTEAPCRACSATGVVISNPCGKCKGRGNHKGKKQISFKIPPGVDNGDYTLQGEGDEVPGGDNGDLIIRVHVKKHELFEREGRDLHMRLPVSMIDAALGCMIKIPTLDGNEHVKIDSGSQPNDVIKVRGKGVSHIRSRGKGDLFVHLAVLVPKKLNKTQKKLLEEFQQATG